MLRRLVPALLALMVPQVAARAGMPEPLTERGMLIEDLYYTLFVLATAVFLLVMAILIVIMVKFRANGGSGRQTFELERDNMKLEFAWIAVPLVVVLWVGVISYAGLVELDEGIQADEAWMELNVTGYQWTWLADYGSGISMFSDPSPVDGSVADDKVFVVPADVPIRFNITGGDVIHAFHLMDANWATVGLVDANPFGPHKYNSVSAVLPEGEYAVQCREMCFNPGHGYMRARVLAVPMADFESFMEEKGLLVGAGLPQNVALSFENGAVAGADDLTFVNGDGSRAIVEFTNPGADATTVSVPGFDLITAEFSHDGYRPSVAQVEQDSIVVAPGMTVRFGFDITTPGDYMMQVGGDVVPFSVVEAQAVQVTLGDFWITPGELSLEKDVTYLFQITNVGQTSHNLFIGAKDADGQTIEWASATIDGGGTTTSLLVTPTQAATFDSWCNVPGHWPAMAGSVMVA